MGLDWQKFFCGNRRFRFRLKLEKTRMRCTPELPSRFCQVCSLQEGAAVMVTLLQVSTLLVLVLSIVTLTAGRSQMEEIWRQNLARDLQSVLGNDSENYQQVYKDAWMIGAWTLIGICSLYFLTGVGVILAAANPAVHPGWCLPWLILTAVLLAGSLCLIVLTIAFIVIIFFTRKVTITADVVPPLLVAAFICFWIYTFVIVLAYWKKMKRTKVAAKIIASTLVPRNIPVSGLHL